MNAHRGNGAAGRSETRRKNLADVGHDLARLVELQVRLLALDANDTGRRLLLPGALGAAATLLMAVSPLLLLFSLAHVLVGAGFSEASAFALSAAAGLVAGGLLFLLAYWRIRRCFGVLRRSRDEFVRNYACMKDVLKKSAETYRAGG